MRESRTHGSEGGEAKAFPTPIVAVQSNRFAYFISSFMQEFFEVLQSKVTPYHVDGRDEPGHDGEGAAPSLAD